MLLCVGVTSSVWNSRFGEPFVPPLCTDHTWIPGCFSQPLSFLCTAFLSLGSALVAQRSVLSAFLWFSLVISISCRFKDLSDLRSEGEGAPVQLFSSFASWLGVCRWSQDPGNVGSRQLQRPDQDKQAGGKAQGEFFSQSPAAQISKQGWGNLMGLFMHCFTYLHMYGCVYIEWQNRVWGRKNLPSQMAHSPLGKQSLK